MKESKPSERSFETKFPQDICLIVKIIMWIAEHRSALTSFEKVNVLLNSEFSIPIKYAWTAVGIYTKNIL